MAELRRFAEGTEVSAERSRAELETLLQRHGAKEFAVYTSEERTVFMYRLRETMVRHTVEYPAELEQFQKKNSLGTPLLKPDQLRRRADDEWRRRWRALVLVCKAKLEIIASGGSTFEREFMADMLLANGETVSQALVPRIKEMYRTGEMPDFPRLLLGPGKGA